MVQNESVANHSAMGWAESTKWGIKTPAIVHGRVRDDVEKQWEEQQQNEKHWQMKMTTNITKTSSEILPSQVPTLGVFDFDFKKNYYRINYNKKVFT